MKIVKSSLILPLILFCQLNADSKEMRIKEFNIGIWPEYDNSGEVFGYFQIALNDSTKLPFKIQVTMPDYLKKVESAIFDKGKLEMIPIEINIIKENNILDIDITSRRFYCQFYFTPFINSNDGHRNIKYNFKIDKYLEQYKVSIQEQFGSRNFNSSITDPNIRYDENKLKYYETELNNLKANTVYDIEVSYLNSSNSSSIDSYNKVIEFHNDMEPKIINNKINNSKKIFYNIHFKVFLTIVVLTITICLINIFTRKGK